MKLKFRYLNLIFFLLIPTTAIIGQNLKNGDYYKKIGNLNLNYTIHGTGPVMIAGHLSSGKIGYELSLKPLEKYFTMVYYNPRGTANSESPKTIEEYGNEYVVDEIENLRITLGVKNIWLFGHSDQSSVCLQYALKFPQNTAGMIISGTSLIGSQKETYARRKESEIKRMKKSPWFAQVVNDWDYMIKNKTETDQSGKDISKSPIKWWCYNEESSQKVIPIVDEVSKAGRRKPINNVFALETEIQRNEYLKQQKKFPEIKAKILIINGKYDTNNQPKYARQLHRVLPNSKLVLIDKSGHFPWIENETQTFAEIENWLKNKD